MGAKSVGCRMLRVMQMMVVGLVVFVQSSSVMAQEVSAREARVDDMHAKARVEARVVTLEMNDAPLASVLRAIAQQAGLSPLYSETILPVDVRVTVHLKHTPAVEAFQDALRGTGLTASIRATGYVAIVRELGGALSVAGEIRGKVVDAKTKQPIVGAKVTLDEAAQGMRTSEDGGYRLVNVAAGTHMVVVKALAYARHKRQIAVGEDGIVTVDVELESAANVLDQVVVTGTIIPTELKAIPNAITIITAKQIEERGITKIDQLFRGDVPGLFALNLGSSSLLDQVTMFSRGVTALGDGASGLTNPIKTYVDGVEMADPQYLSQLDPKSIERIEILTGPQASTIYGSNAINGVMQIFTKRGTSNTPQLTLNLISGFVQNNFSRARTPQHDYGAQLNGIEGRLSYNAGGSWNYIGPWTPAKQLTRISSFGGIRFELPTPGGHVTTDLTLRRALTQSLQRGSQSQTQSAYQASGWWTPSFLGIAVGLADPTTRTLTGQTLGLTLSYIPSSWWSHDLGLGQDVEDTERRYTARGYQSLSDTTLRLVQSHTDRRSVRYTTTARVSVTTLAQLTLTAGADSWQSLSSSIEISPQTLTGILTGSTSISRQPGHNSGGFVQSQLGFQDRLFFTYGVRLERNPTIGDKVHVVPGRYGVAYTQDVGAVTAKVRGSYGRSIRPPAPTLKNAVPQTDASIIALYGPYDDILANPELAPEYQQGGEGGVELYLGTRGSLIVTRYNQTVDQLIMDITGIDSVRSLTPCFSPFGCSQSSNFEDADGYVFRYQSQNINLGSIRNQGWELQSSVNLGPLTMRGTYSWTKSRVIGITPKYREFFNPVYFPQYQPGTPFYYLPEHTWAFGGTYTHVRSSVGLDVTGLGQTQKNSDFNLQHLSGSIRLPQNNRFRVTAGSYTITTPYTLIGLTASQRFSARIEALLQVQNLADRYINDSDAFSASLGRQVKLGGRVRTN